MFLHTYSGFTESVFVVCLSNLLYVAVQILSIFD